MRSGFLLILVFLSLFSSRTELTAQTPIPSPTAGLPTGDSVRVKIDGTQLVLKRVRSTKRGAIIGAIAGGSVGLVGGTILASNMSTIFGERRTSLPKAIGTGVLIGAGGAVTWGLIGAGVGSLFSRDEWKRVKINGTSVSVSF